MSYFLKNVQLKKFTIYLAQKDVQATGEAFSPQKKTTSTSRHENSELFILFLGLFLPSWFRIPNPNPLT
jgi:hypothetical protein